MARESRPAESTDPDITTSRTTSSASHSTPIEVGEAGVFETRICASVYHHPSTSSIYVTKMGSKDNDDQPEDLSKWLESFRADARKLQNELERDLRRWSGSDDSPSPSNHDNRKNPFERFIGFVDDNLATLAQGFRRFPSNISELNAKMQQEREARLEEEREIWRRWTGSDDSPDHVRMQIDRASVHDREDAKDAALMLLRESFKQNQHVPVQKICDLYQDNDWKFGGLDRFASPMLSFGGACYYKPETVENLPSTARWGWPAAQPQWLSIEWFKRSPYSPVRIEEQGGKMNWRAAFEDLLCGALDKPMVSGEKIGVRPFGKPQSTYRGPGLDWMLSLQCRGILPPQLPFMYRCEAVTKYNMNRNTLLSSEYPRSDDLSPLADQNDFKLLVDEVSTRSGPETGGWSTLQTGVVPWNVPTTEAELYEQMEPLHQEAWNKQPEDLRLGPKASEDKKPKVVWEDSIATSEKPVNVQLKPKSKEEKQYDEIWDKVEEALFNHDPAIMREALDAYHAIYGSVGELVEEVTNALNFEHSATEAVLKEGLLSSKKIPKQDVWKRLVALSEEDRQWFTKELVKTRYPDEENWDGALLSILLDEADEHDIEALLHCLEGSPSPTHTVLTPSKEQSERSKPDILSQLTTTQTTRLPDGTVTTKIVLKQRFADGREEEHESVHTTHEDDSHRKSQLAEKKATGEQEKKKGWFWS